MATTNTTPTYIYKILPAAPPDPIPERLPVSELDTTSGFIHLSTAKQVPQTLKLFFTDNKTIYLLRLVYDNVRPVTKWENGAGEQGQPGSEGFFPHLYNDLNLGSAEVESNLKCERQDGQDWAEALSDTATSTWLQY